jgi:hypothetical protein
MVSTRVQAPSASRHLSWLLALVLVVESLLAAVVLPPAQRQGTAAHRGGPAVSGVPVFSAAPLRTADTVSTFVEVDLAPGVRVLEDALARANEEVLAQHAGEGDARAMSARLLAQAQRLQAVAEELSSAPLPLVPGDVSQHLRGMVEDLLLASQQLEVLLQETAAAVTQETINGPVGRDGAASVGYSQRVRSTAALLRRAQSWLQTINHETGGHTRLPGFASGTSPLMAQFSLP